MDLDNNLLKPYRLRTVRIAVQATGLALALLAVYPLVSGHGSIRSAPYFALMAFAIVGALSFNFLPWNKILDSPRGIWVFYAWSFLDIVLITLLVAVTGGGRSEVFLLYALTTLFLAASYPPMGQAGLMVVTFGLYLIAVAANGWNITPGQVLMRLGTIGALTVMGHFMSRELMAQMAAHSLSRDESSKRAELLGTVAKAAKYLSTLDSERVFAEVVRSTANLGFEASNLCIISADNRTYEVAYGVGLPQNYEELVHKTDEGMVGLVLQSGETVFVDDYSSYADGVQEMRDAGFRYVIATPVWVRDKIAAALVGGTRSERKADPSDVEALELLAAQAGAALDNAYRYEQERNTVQRLEELDRLKQDFIATMSHELRTPLTVIRGMGQTLQRRAGGMSEELRDEFLARINENSESLEEMITDLLDFSRLQSKNLEAEPRIVDISTLLLERSDKVRPLLNGRQLNTDLGESLLLKADIRLMQKAIDHLLGNAIKHTPPEATILLSATNAGNDALISVTDDGAGIDPRDLPHLTDDFYRGGELNTRPTRGTGMGLSFVKKVLGLHSSELEISNVASGGARFAFRLPLVLTTFNSGQLEVMGQDNGKLQVAVRPASTATD